jgi:hypothetical protein
MVVNFRTREISRGTHKLARTSTLKKKKIAPNIQLIGILWDRFICIIVSRSILLVLNLE